MGPRMTAVIPVSTLTVSVGLLDQTFDRCRETFEELLTEDTVKYKSTVRTVENYQVTATENLFWFLEYKGFLLREVPCSLPGLDLSLNCWK